MVEPCVAVNLPAVHANTASELQPSLFFVLPLAVCSCYLCCGCFGSSCLRQREADRMGGNRSPLKSHCKATGGNTKASCFDGHNQIPCVFPFRRQQETLAKPPAGDSCAYWSGSCWIWPYP